MKKNQKMGFVLIETLIVSTLILTTLVFLYLEFKSIRNKYEYSFKYNTVSGIYMANEMSNFLSDNGYENLKNLLNDETYYVDITSSSSVEGSSSEYTSLIDNMNIKKIIFTKDNIESLKVYLSGNNYDKTLFNSKFKEYILKINFGSSSKYRIIIEFNDDTYASILIGSTIGGTIPRILPQAGETHKGIVYLDPTNLSATCNQENSVSTPGTKSGCMKFYIYDDSGDSYKMILDHNTTARVAWNSNGSNASMGEVATALTTDTTGWSGSPRLITANEIASVTGNTGFDSATATSSQWFYLDSNNQTQTATSAGASRYAWLFDYTNGCTSYGCNIADSSTYGYWTSSSVSGSSSYAWLVRNFSRLYSVSVDDVDFSGVRPVIILSKSLFRNVNS